MCGLTIGMVSWGAPATLWKTLASYRRHGLIADADQFLIFFNEQSPLDLRLARRFRATAIGSSDNIGIGRALTALVEKADFDDFLFLENDWELVEDAAVTRARLERAREVLANGRADVVKLRHRHRHGAPLMHAHYKGHEDDAPHFALDALHWLDPSARFPDRVRKERIGGEDWFFATARSSNFTNNPCLYRTRFVRERIVPFAQDDGTDLELAMNAWWLNNDDIAVCQGPGLFMHSRIDRGRLGIAWLRTFAGVVAKRYGIRRAGRVPVDPRVGGPWRSDL